MKSKLQTLEDLKPLVDSAKQQGKTIVFANGVFDLLHVGHVRYLQDAKSQGDVLIVGLNSDDSTRRLKGEGRPLFSQNDRALMLSGLACVDSVIIFEDDTADRLLLELRPHIHCKGGDYLPENIPERNTVRSYGGTATITGGGKVQSTGWLLREIKRRYRK